MDILLDIPTMVSGDSPKKFPSNFYIIVQWLIPKFLSKKITR